MGFVEFAAFDSLLFEELDLDLEASVNLAELGGFVVVPFLQLEGGGTDLLNLVPAFGELFGQLIVLGGEEGVLLDESLASGLELVRFSHFYLEQGYLIEQPSVLGFAAVGVLQSDLFLNEISLGLEPFDGGPAVWGSFARRVSIIRHEI